MNLSHQKRSNTASRYRLGALALLVLVLVVVVTSDASASGTLPVSPTFLSATTAYGGLQVKPATITYTGDGTGLLAGASVRNRQSGIDWSKWTTDLALGTGFNQLNNCEPDCAGGTFTGYPVKIELWRPRTLHGTLVFTRMTIFYERTRPRGQPSHYTFTDTYRSGALGGYSWWPPGEQGYCVNTFGQPPEASCKNIHMLP
jgi:hypothetical protein